MMLLQNGKIREKALMISNKHEVKMIAVKNKRGAENENPNAIEGKAENLYVTERIDKSD